MHGHNISTTRFKKQSLNDLKRGVDCSEGLQCPTFNNVSRVSETGKKITEENFVLESSLETNESARYMDSTQEEQAIYNLIHTQGEISLQDRY